MMTKDQISALLHRFMDGETTEHEEQLLAQYFATAKDIPTEWQEYKLMFDSFDSQAYDFSDEQLDSFCQEPKDVEFATSDNKQSKIFVLRHHARAISIAASVAALISVGSLYLHKQAESPTLAISNQQAAKVITTNKPSLAQTVPTSIDTDRKQNKNTDKNTMQARCLQKKIYCQTAHLKEDGDKDNSIPQPTSIAPEAEEPTILTEATYGMPNFDNAVRYIAAAEIAHDHVQEDDDAPYMEGEKQNLAYRNRYSQTASIASSDEIQFSIVCNVRQEPQASAVDAEYGYHD